jgi:hypothetical protein
MSPSNRRTCDRPAHQEGRGEQCHNQQSKSDAAVEKLHVFKVLNADQTQIDYELRGTTAK